MDLYKPCARNLTSSVQISKPSAGVQQITWVMISSSPFELCSTCSRTAPALRAGCFFLKDGEQSIHDPRANEAGKTLRQLFAKLSCGGLDSNGISLSCVYQ